MPQYLKHGIIPHFNEGVRPMAKNDFTVPGRVSNDRHVRGPLTPTGFLAIMKWYWFEVNFVPNLSRQDKEGIKEWIITDVIPSRLATHLGVEIDKVTFKVIFFVAPMLIVNVTSGQKYKPGKK